MLCCAQAAAAALDSLKKPDLTELKSMSKPPAGVDDVTGACIYMLHDGGKGKIDTSWKSSVIMMKDVTAFLNELLGFKQRIDDGNVPKQNFKNLRPLLAKEHFSVEPMRNKSSAAAGLCDFVLNITKYWDINEDVEPKRQQALTAANQLAEAIAAKDEALANKAAAEEAVEKLTEAYETAVKEKEDTIAEAENCERKLGLAKRLIAALGSEGARWEAAIIAKHSTAQHSRA